MPRHPAHRLPRGTSSPCRRHQDGAFTLIEMIVVLILVSLISLLVVDGFSQVLLIKTRYLGAMERYHTEALGQFWFRGLVTGLTPDVANGDYVFKGDANGFSGISLCSLHMSAGVPGAFALTITTEQNGIALRYHNAKARLDWAMGFWRSSDAHFSYLDADMIWRKDWPPVIGEEQQLPEAIMLEIDDPVSPLAWVVSIPGQHTDRTAGVRGFME